ncbi:hypothetical protein LY78DRAFT_672607 [Colletotrichum sublineola]|nr:hypothetical protein LY78DRAFT_672607 [Colletotrichum sublineola]
MLACGLDPGEGEIDLLVRMIRMLLEYGAGINIKDTGDDVIAAIHYASRARNPKISKFLSDAGANLGELDGLGRTVMHQLIFGSQENSSLSFDSKRNRIPGQATECLAILTQKCGPDILNKNAEWEEYYKKEPNYWDSMDSVRTPLSLAVFFEDWEVFKALYDVGASFETNVPPDQYLNKAFLQPQLPAIEVLVQTGAAFLSGREGEVNDGICIFSQGHGISFDEVESFKKIQKMLIP